MGNDLRCACLMLGAALAWSLVPLVFARSAL